MVVLRPPLIGAKVTRPRPEDRVRPTREAVVDVDVDVGLVFGPTAAPRDLASVTRLATCAARSARRA